MSNSGDFNYINYINDYSNNNSNTQNPLGNNNIYLPLNVNNTTNNINQSSSSNKSKTNNVNIGNKFKLHSSDNKDFIYGSYGSGSRSSGATIVSKKTSSNNIINIGNINSNINQDSIKEEEMDIEESEDDTILFNICQNHAITLPKNYDYEQNQVEKEINSLLIEMDSFGHIIKKKINEEYRKNPHNYLTLDESFKECLPLALLKMDLENNNCTCEIEREEAKDDMRKKEAITAVQFIFNGMYKFKKYIFEIKNKNKQIDLKFTENLLVSLSKIWQIDTKDILLNTTFKDSGFISAIIKAPKYNELDKSSLLKKLIVEVSDDISKVDISILLNGCIINKIWLENNKIENQLIKGKWNEFRINVSKIMDTSNYDLHNIDIKNEWSIAYHCINVGINNYFKNHMDQYGHNIGEGVYMSPKPEIMESSCPEITYDKKKYKIGIICRLRPDKIRYPNGFENYWIINGTDNEIRPWGFIIKEFS